MGKEIEKPEDLEKRTIESKGIVKILRSDEYKGIRVVIRRIYADYFEYVIPYENNVYSSYFIIKPKEGDTELTEDEVSEVSALVYSGAMATIDSLLGEELSEEEKKAAELFEESREKVKDNG